MAGQDKRNLKAIAADIASGYVTVNPLFLKPFNEESLKSLYSTVMRQQTEIRIEPFPYHEIDLIRQRSLKLQRLHAALTIIKNVARERRYKFY